MFDKMNNLVDKPGIIKGILAIFGALITMLGFSFGMRDQKRNIDQTFADYGIRRKKDRR